MKTKILLVSYLRPSTLPPFLAIIDSLLSTKQFSLTVLVGEEDPEIDELYNGKDVIFKHYFNNNFSTNKYIRRLQVYRNEMNFYAGIKRDLDCFVHDILWVVHEITSIRIKNFIKEPFIQSIYELNDNNPRLINKLKPIAKKATVNVVCEYNRSQMMKVWYKLDDAPMVLPNKPFCHPRVKNIATKTIVDNITDKIILYQGRMYPGERNLDALCQAVSSMKGFTLVLMGHENEYSKGLVERYPKVKLIGYIKAPFHLNVTSHAYIGVVTYSYMCLNTIYCAPNKIWEYSGFDIPMIANDIPGLKYTVESQNAGICVDTDDVDAIKSAIETIDSNYEKYSKNAKSMYDNCDILQIIKNIIVKFENKNNK